MQKNQIYFEFGWQIPCLFLSGTNYIIHKLSCCEYGIILLPQLHGFVQSRRVKQNHIIFNGTYITLFNNKIRWILFTYMCGGWRNIEMAVFIPIRCLLWLFGNGYWNKYCVFMARCKNLFASNLLGWKCQCYVNPIGLRANPILKRSSCIENNEYKMFFGVPYSNGCSRDPINKSQLSISRLYLPISWAVTDIHLKYYTEKVPITDYSL